MALKKVKFYTPIVQFPDCQLRIYKSIPDIRWINKVHETLTGYKTMAHLPIDPEFSLIHKKDIKRQEIQNDFYNRL